MLNRLRSDLQFDRVAVGNDGLWIYRIYDPVSEKFFKISQTVYEIICSLAVSENISDLGESLVNQNLNFTDSDISKVILFLKRNNLLFDYPVSKEPKSAFNRIIQSYLYFKFPIWLPGRFLADTKYLASLILNKYSVYFLTFTALMGFILLAEGYDNFLTGIKASLSLSKIKFFIPVLIIIKAFHELSHAYTATVLGCKVRSIGVALILMTPRLYTDVSDMVILDSKSRIKIAAAGMWAEFIIAGFACFLFIASPLHSTVSHLSISIILISLVSSLLFNGNPLMKFDGYYVLKEVLKIDNLYSNASLAVKAFWRQILLGIKPEHSINFILLFYGHLSLLYRIFLYSIIVLLVYHFFIPAVGIILAIVEIRVFFIKPLSAEFLYINKHRRLISGYYRFVIISLFSGFIYLLVMETKLPESYPAHFTSERRLIRAEVEGIVVAVNDSNITLENKKLQLEAEKLKLDLAAVKIRQQQMLASGDYTLLKLSEEIEHRLTEKLNHTQKKLDKLIIKLPEESFLFLEKSTLMGSKVKAGGELAYTKGEIKLYAYLDSGSEEEIRENYLYFENEMEAFPCEINPLNISDVKFLIPQLSSLHDGPLQTENSYRPLKPLKRAEFFISGVPPQHDITCTIVRYRKTRLFLELQKILIRFYLKEFF